MISSHRQVPAHKIFCNPYDLGNTETTIGLILFSTTDDHKVWSQYLKFKLGTWKFSTAKSKFLQQHSRQERGPRDQVSNVQWFLMVVVSESLQDLHRLIYFVSLSVIAKNVWKDRTNISRLLSHCCKLIGYISGNRNPFTPSLFYARYFWFWAGHLNDDNQVHLKQTAVNCCIRSSDYYVCLVDWT
jgi:hypothetical protein